MLTASSLFCAEFSYNVPKMSMKITNVFQSSDNFEFELMNFNDLDEGQQTPPILTEFKNKTTRYI